jgi:CRISPR system Cascade subunit CasD
MGIARGEDLSRFSSLRMGVRVDREGRVERDYHTANEVIKADGSEHDTVVSNRDYLADASFTVGLESDDPCLLEDIADALREPTWFLFLGRKSFPLASPPITNENPIRPGTLEDNLLNDQPGKRVLLEAPDGERVQEDWPLCFFTRRFSIRNIKTTYIEGGRDEK